MKHTKEFDFDIGLSLKLSEIVHDLCENVPLYIGMKLAQ